MPQIILFLLLAALGGATIGARAGYKAGVRRGLDIVEEIIKNEQAQREEAFDSGAVRRRDDYRPCQPAVARTGLIPPVLAS